MIEAPIFIVGPGRSGTTLLRSLLSAHSRIAVTPETHFMVRAEAWGLENGAPADFEPFWKAYTSSIRFRDLGVEPSRCRELIEMQGTHSFEAIFRAILSAYGERTGKRRVGEKTPGHFRFLPHLLDWFPDARILVTQRDPRAVVASQLHTQYVKSRLTPRSLRHGLVSGKRAQEIAFFAHDWASIFETHLARWRDDPRFHTVVYEALVRNVEEEIRAICRFLGELYEPTMLTGRNEATVPMPAGKLNDSLWEQWRWEHHARTLGRISSDSLEKWKEELTEGEIAMIEGRCARAMLAAGYAPLMSRSRRSAGRLSMAAISAAGAAETRARAAVSNRRRSIHTVRGRLRSAVGSILAAGVDRGVPAAWFGYRWVRRETVQEYFARHGGAGKAGQYETIHPECVARNPLPCNVASRDELPDDRGWWGFSFRDVPERTSGETFIATIPDCLVTWYRDPVWGNDFYPAIVTGDGRALELREVRFRPLHAATLRQSGRPARLKRAIWFIERVYHNHSHWLTAHLPKLLLLRERGMLGDVLLPPERTAAIDGSLRMLGLEPERFRTFDPARPLQVEELTVLGTDRFRPELLQLVPPAYGVVDAAPPRRRIFVSRAKASRRRLVNEDEVWSLLEPAGFQRVLMEELRFEDQVTLMREAAIVCAPHGAGLANMVFCPPGAQVVEIADLGFPNPNFYALASALGHRYWLVPAASFGDGHPLEKNLRADPAAICGILPSLVD